MDNLSQCPNCHRWFTNGQSLMLHIALCRMKSSARECHLPFEHHAPRSIKLSVISSKQCCKINPTLYDKDGPDFNTNVKHNEPTFGLSDTDNNIGTVNSMHHSEHNFGLQSDSNDNCNDDDYDPQGQQSTAISEVQIQLNILINNHKASLKLYDDIINFSNDYVSSPNFDKYASLKPGNHSYDQ